MIHELEPTRFHVTLGSHEPALRVESGDTIRTWTVDSGGYDSSGEQIAEGGNAQTGPIFVEDAQPGDTLSVRFDRIRPNRTRGVTAPLIAPNVLDPGFQLGDADRDEDFWVLDLERGTARLQEPAPKGLETLELELDPMLGCFGVAPARGEAISTATSAQHGGNMDYRGFREGVTVYLPIFVEGALLHVGDGHALQGEGEIVGTGIEVSMDVELTVEVLKGKTIWWPRGENDDFLFAVGNARPLDQAVQHATSELVRWLRADYELGYRSISALLGQCLRYDVGNVYDPAYTMVAKIEKRLLRSP